MVVRVVRGRRGERVLLVVRVVRERRGKEVLPGSCSSSSMLAYDSVMSDCARALDDSDSLFERTGMRCGAIARGRTRCLGWVCGEG